MLNHRRRMKSNDGFTLIELLVVVSIVTIMSVVILANLPNFRDKTSLTLIAQQVATIARQSQIYGITQKQQLADYITSQNEIPYGLSFQRSSNNFSLVKKTTSKPFTLNDSDSSVTDIGRSYLIPSNIQVSAICADDNGQAANGDCGNQNNSYDSVIFTFVGTYPEPDFCLKKSNNNNNHCLSDQPPGVVRIILYSPGLKDGRAIEIWKNGQISFTSNLSP